MSDRTQGQILINAPRERILDAIGDVPAYPEWATGTTAAEVTEALQIPTIGIGAGPHCDAQVLVWQDMAGLTPGRTAKFVKKYADVAGVLDGAVRSWADDVVAGTYPGPEHGYR